MSDDTATKAPVNLREGRTGPPTGPPPRFDIEPDWGRRIIREQLEPAAALAQELGRASRALLLFVPEHLNPIVVTRDRIEDVRAGADAFLELIDPDQGSLTTADLGDQHRQHTRMTRRLRELVPTLEHDQAATVIDELLAA